MTPPIKRGTARRLGLRRPPVYRQRFMLGIDPAPGLREFAAATMVPFEHAATELRRAMKDLSWTIPRHFEPRDTP